ncbi:MAG: ABC transporter permease [Clostridia bacterium]|nr:ABC transporter permease [Clostridia bacterium]
MKGFRTVFRFELRNLLSKRGIWVATILVVTMVFFLACIPRFMDTAASSQRNGEGQESTDTSVIDRLQESRNLDRKGAEGALHDKTDVGTAVGMILMNIMLIAITGYSVLIINAMAEEKTFQTVELLVTSTSPKSLILGKVLASATLAVIQLAIVVLAGVLGVWANGSRSPISLAEATGIAPQGFACFFAFAIPGLLFYVFMLAAEASLMTNVDGRANAFGIGYTTFIVSYTICACARVFPEKTGSKVLRVMSILPCSSPFAMVLRYFTTTVSIGDLSVSLVLLVAATILVIKLSIQIYRLGILNYGNKISVFKAIGLAIRKN